MCFENVDDFHKETASFPAKVDEKQDIPHLHLRLIDHLHPEFLAKRQRMGMSSKNNVKWINKLYNLSRFDNKKFKIQTYCRTWFHWRSTRKRGDYMASGFCLPKRV